MGNAVGYDFDIVQIRRGIYSPVGHVNFELENQVIRRLSVEVLSGQRALPLDVRSLPAVAPEVPPTAQRPQGSSAADS